MLKDTTLAKMATLLKIDQAALKTAITATDEQEVAIPDNLQVMTAPEVETRDRNKYNEGKTAGTEMVLKEIKTKHLIEVDGVDPDKIVDAIGKKAVEAAKIAPDEQVKAANKLVDQWKQKAIAAEQKATDLETKTSQLSIDNRLRGLFPKNRSEVLTDDEFLMVVKGKYTIETKDGKEVVIDKATNEIVRDKTKLEPVAPGDVLTGYFTEKKWIAEEQKGGGGRGAGNSNPGAATGKFSKLSEIRAHVEASGQNPLGQKGQAMIQAALKENPDVDLNS